MLPLLSGQALQVPTLQVQGPERLLRPPGDGLVLLHQPLVQEARIRHWEAHCAQR